MTDPRLSALVVGPTATIQEAMRAIDSGAVEIALILDGAGVLLGTVSDGDIRRALLGGADLSDPVRPYATSAPVTAVASTPRAAVLDLMQARSISQIPIVDKEGILTGLHVLHDLLGGASRPNGAVIMAGGRGSRLGKLTDATPKPMLKVAGRPILERLVLHLVGSGVREIRLSVNYLGDVVRDHFADGSDFGCRISYLVEQADTPLGTAGSLSLLEPDDPVLAHPILVMNGDLVTDFSVDDLLRHHQQHGAVATMAVGEHRYQVPFGVAERDGDTLQAVIEKPAEVWPVNAGIYVLEPQLVQRVPADSLFHVTDLLNDCLAKGEYVSTWPVSSEWKDVGRPTELQSARGLG